MNESDEDEFMEAESGDPEETDDDESDNKSRVDYIDEEIRSRNNDDDLEKEPSQDEMLDQYQAGSDRSNSPRNILNWDQEIIITQIARVRTGDKRKREQDSTIDCASVAGPKLKKRHLDVNPLEAAPSNLFLTSESDDQSEDVFVDPDPEDDSSESNDSKSREDARDEEEEEESKNEEDDSDLMEQSQELDLFDHSTPHLTLALSQVQVSARMESFAK